MRADLLNIAIESCFTQEVNTEIIVVDDGSTDGTFNVLEEKYPCQMATQKLRYFYQNNMGPSAARNLGMLNSRGDFIKFLDSDDVLIPGALRRELEFAIAEKCDVVVTGWRNDYYLDVFATSLDRSEEVEAPDFSEPLDAMLRGLAPWTAAALYRLEAIKNLRWNTQFDKAEEWLWVWTVLLAGCKFKTLSLISAIWNHYPSQQRLTMKGNSYDRSSRSRVRILQMVGEQLKANGYLTKERRKILCQYLHKDAVWASRVGFREWRGLYSYILSIDPGFFPVEENNILSLLIRYLGYYYGVLAYGRAAYIKSIFLEKIEAFVCFLLNIRQ